MDRLFAYGTLQHPEIMGHVLGRIPEHLPATLQDFARYAIKGQDFPGLVPEENAITDGTLFAGITQEEWLRLDRYESDWYERRSVNVQAVSQAGGTAYAYIIPDHNRHLLSNLPWQLCNYQPRPD